MHANVRSRVRVGDKYSEEFDVVVGVQQESVISPLLFNIVLEAISCSFKSGCPHELLYADDLAINEELLLRVERGRMAWNRKAYE